MNLNGKIKFINNYVDNKASFTHYSNGWEFGTYADNNIFSLKGKIGYMYDEDFETLCDRIIEIIFKKEEDSK